jgi:Holliday junction resolvasome RuvABC endonuclease subunit
VKLIGLDPGATMGMALIHLDTQSRPAFILGAATREPLDDVASWLETYKPDLLAIESVTTVYSRSRFGASMAQALMASAKLTGRILQMAQGMGIATAEATAHEWRGAIIGKRNATDKQIKAALMQRVALMPKRSSAHVRDAIGVAVFCGMREMQERKGAA